MSGELVEARKELEPGWDYWQQCSERCQDNSACQYWTVIILPGDYSRHTCQLYSTKTGTVHADQTFRFSNKALLQHRKENLMYLMY